MKQTAKVAGTAAMDTMLRRSFALFAVAAAMLAVQNSGRAEDGDRSGKEVVTAVCANCHATGANGSPKIGDKEAWSKLSAQSLSSLTGVVLKGIRQMPPHGGNMKLTDTEIKRAVTYMVNQSGGHWIEPTSKMNPPATRTGKQIVQAQCFKCHEKGLHGAPKIGNADDWIPRVKNGLDAVVRSAINGHGGMPSRGGMANLTDAEMREAVIYMMNKGRVPEKASSVPEKASK